MTRTHTARIEIRRWKAHACVGCGARYAYLMVRKLAYGGSTPECAMEKAQAAADRAVAREVDRQPCPTCGLCQPDMIAAGRRTWHAWSLVLSLLVTGVLAGLYLGDMIQANRILALAMQQVAFFGLLGFLIDYRNPNRDLAANRRAAEQKIAAGQMRIILAGNPLVVAPGGTTTAFALFSVGLAILALSTLALPELMRWRAGWPLNAGCYPPVAGPGDVTVLYLPDSISSIKGFWTGTSKVTAQIAEKTEEAQAGEFAMESSTRHLDWDKLIEAQSDNRAINARLWVRLKLPSDAKYAGKTLACNITLGVRYPVVHNDGRLVPAVQFYHHEAALELAAPQAASRYRSWWSSGFVAGTVFLLFSMLTRIVGAEALRKTAAPTEILDDDKTE